MDNTEKKMDVTIDEHVYYTAINILKQVQMAKENEIKKKQYTCCTWRRKPALN